VQLSLHADYGLRVLIYLASHPGEIVSTKRISDTYGISKNHLVRVMQTLGEHGYIRMIPGRSGGVTLAKDIGSIRIGNVVRDAEPSLDLVECFNRETNQCPIINVCGLRAHLTHALQVFIAELNKHTLADLMAPPRHQSLATVFLQLQPPSAPARRPAN
jgi:Rrf2 family nitric oxide-sensitive transcriptional repressor